MLTVGMRKEPSTASGLTDDIDGEPLRAEHPRLHRAFEKGVTNVYRPTTTKQASGRISQLSRRRRGAAGTSR
jgi:hypothetical protein